MATQADVDAVTQALQGVSTQVNDLTTTLAADDSALAAEIQKLQGQGVDVTGLQAVQQDLSAKAQALSTAVDQTTALVPAPTPAPTPAPGA